MSAIDSQNIPDRLQTLGRLTNWNFDILKKKERLFERMFMSSDYYPTIGIEIETFSDHYPGNKLPKDLIAKVEKLGIPFDRKDSFHSGYEHLENKWEAALEKSPTHVLLAREIQELRKKKVLNVKRERINYPSEHYPVHITLGSIQADFPDFAWGNGKADNDNWTYAKKKLYPGNEIPKDLNEDILQSSDCYLLARALDATAWVTSLDRFKGYKLRDGSNQGRGYRLKGTSGMSSRNPSEKTGGHPCIEIRTCEIWGEKSLINLEKYMGTSQAIGAMLRAYQTIPQEYRDKALLYENKGDHHQALLELFKGYDPVRSKDHDWQLARMWLEFRREIRQIYAEEGLLDPMKEYDQNDFIKLGEKFGKKNRTSAFSKIAIDCVIRYRSQVRNLLGEQI